MIQTYLITVALAVGFAFGAGWKTNDWKHNAHEKQAVEAAAVAQRELHALEQKRSSGVISAQNVARTREIVLRRDADSARDAIDGLREQSAVALQGARTDHDSCVIANTRFSVALNQCAAEYQAMGAIADRWQSDAVMLQDAWPR